jgi:F-type H+-transporting ATPase subunit b
LKRFLLCLPLTVLIPCAVAQHAGSAPSTASGAAHEDKAGGHGDSSTLWKTVNFILLAAALGYGISKTAGAFFRSRTAKIQEGIAEATKMRGEAEARATEMERRLANLGAEIENLRKTAGAETAAEGERVNAETARLLAKVQANAEQEIASAVDQARKELRAYSSELALDLARWKIRDRLTPALDEAFFDSFLRDLERTGRRAN